jgi:preprotein translocase subunit SecG
MPGPLMKGDAAMTQATIVLAFLFGLVGIMLWIIGVIALDIFHDSQRNREKRQETAEPEQYVGYGPPQAHHSSHRL